MQSEKLTCRRENPLYSIVCITWARRTSIVKQIIETRPEFKNVCHFIAVLGQLSAGNNLHISRALGNGTFKTS